METAFSISKELGIEAVDAATGEPILRQHRPIRLQFTKDAKQIATRKAKVEDNDDSSEDDNEEELHSSFSLAQVRLLLTSLGQSSKGSEIELRSRLDNIMLNPKQYRPICASDSPQYCEMRRQDNGMKRSQVQKFQRIKGVVNTTNSVHPRNAQAERLQRMVHGEPTRSTKRCKAPRNSAIITSEIVREPLSRLDKALSVRDRIRHVELVRFHQHRYLIRVIEEEKKKEIKRVVQLKTGSHTLPRDLHIRRVTKERSRAQERIRRLVIQNDRELVHQLAELNFIR